MNDSLANILDRDQYELKRERPRFVECAPADLLLPVSFSQEPSGDMGDFYNQKDHQTIYAHRLADILNAVVHEPFVLKPEPGLLAKLKLAVEKIQPDVLIIDKYGSPRFRKKTSWPAAAHLVRTLDTSMIFSTKPRWPLENLLVILADGKAYNNSAIEWAGQFAHSIQASVTILIVLPPVPLMYGHTLRHSMPRLFQSTDPLGAKVRWIAEYFSVRGIRCTFKIRQGEFGCPVKSEIINSDADMIFIAIESNTVLWNALMRDPISHILNHTDCPVMFTRDPDRSRTIPLKIG